MRKITSLVVLFAFLTTGLIPQSGLAQQMILPEPGVMVHLSPEFTPASLKGMVINPNDPFKFDFVIHRGDKQLTQVQKQEEYTRLIKYFLAALAVPDEQQWVNLSPYEKNRIIPDTFGQTEMGRDLLAEDYMLKQITASMIYPEDTIGRKFWQNVYAQAQVKYGTTNVPINTFNKVWIVPDKAVVYEKGNAVYVLQSHLKVMLEEDYLSLEKHERTAKSVVNTLGSQIIRQIVIPELTKEVNEGRNFAPLRQVFSGMLLATWYKRALKESILGKLYANKNKLKGVDQDPKNNQQIYNQYLQAFKKGVFNLIKEDTDRYTRQTIPRKYFSGGMRNTFEQAMTVVNYAQSSQIPVGEDDIAEAELESSDAASGDMAMASQHAAFIAVSSIPADASRNSFLKISAVDPAMRGRVFLQIDFDDNGMGDDYFQEADVLSVLDAIKEQIEGWKEYRNPQGDIVGRVIYDPKEPYHSLVNSVPTPYSNMDPVVKNEIINGLMRRIAPIRENKIRKLGDWRVSHAPSGEFVIQLMDQRPIRGPQVEMKNALLAGADHVGHNIVAMATSLDFHRSRRDHADWAMSSQIEHEARVSALVKAFLQSSRSSIVVALSPTWVQSLIKKRFDNALKKKLDLEVRARLEEYLRKTGEPSITFEEFRDHFSLEGPNKKIEVDGVASEGFGRGDIYIWTFRAKASEANAAMIASRAAIVVAFVSLFSSYGISQTSNRGKLDIGKYMKYKTHYYQLTPDLSLMFRPSRGNYDEYILGYPEKFIKPAALKDALVEGLKAFSKKNEEMPPAEDLIKAVGGLNEKDIDKNSDNGGFFTDVRVPLSGVAGNQVVSGDENETEGYPSFSLRKGVHIIRNEDGEDIKVKITEIKKTIASDGKKTYLVKFNFNNKKYFVINVDSDEDFYKGALLRIHNNQPTASLNPGGIDMNAAHLDLQIKRDGKGMVLPISQQNLENIHIDGLVPVILEIRPATASPILSELTASSLTATSV